jgi:hypothetical protein
VEWPLILFIFTPVEEKVGINLVYSSKRSILVRKSKKT